eukprot:2669879-Pyramimonas_sp.AAC.1
MVSTASTTAKASATATSIVSKAAKVLLSSSPTLSPSPSPLHFVLVIFRIPPRPPRVLDAVRAFVLVLTLLLLLVLALLLLMFLACQIGASRRPGRRTKR